MSTTTPPVLLTAGKTAQVLPPVSGQCVAVVLANVSPFILAMTVGGRPVYLQPWTENLFDISNTGSAPINVTPTLPANTTLPAGSAAQVNATWYFQDEVPTGTWPISLTANAIASAIAGLVQVQSQVKIAQIGQGIIPNNGNVTLDVSGYSQISVTLSATDIAPIGNILLNWLDAGGNIVGNGINFNATNQPFTLNVPTLGAKCRLSYLLGAATGCLYNLTATTGTLPSSAASTYGNPLEANAVSVGPADGLKEILRIPPTASKMQLWGWVANANVSLYVQPAYTFAAQLIAVIGSGSSNPAAATWYNLNVTLNPYTDTRIIAQSPFGTYQVFARAYPEYQI